MTFPDPFPKSDLKKPLPKNLKIIPPFIINPFISALNKNGFFEKLIFLKIKL